jgi:hypothetical protein
MSVETVVMVPRPAIVLTTVSTDIYTIACPGTITTVSIDIYTIACPGTITTVSTDIYTVMVPGHAIV